MRYFDLDLDVTQEDREVRSAAHEFALEVMRPAAKEFDKMAPEDLAAPGSAYWDFLAQGFQLGYHAVTFPEEVGGPGLSPLQVHMVMEEMAWGSFGLTIALNTSLHASACLGGPQRLIDEFTIPLCACTDASETGCWAMTEPDHGSDSIALGYPSFHDPSIGYGCRARLDGDEYVINGQKAAWVSGGPIAKSVLLMCNLDSERGHAGGGAFVFSLDRPGVSRGRPIDKIGSRELLQGELYFNDVRVPKDHLLYGPEDYEAELAAHFALTTPMVSTFGVGVARAAFEETLAYCRERRQGGKLLVDHPNVQQKLFDMFRKVEAARQISRAAFVHNWSKPPKQRKLEYGFAAKTFATQAAMEVVGEAIMLFGTNALTKEYLIEKLFRDAQCLSHCDGSNDSLAIFGGHLVSETY
jgi:acyl-CoA dehydrogenase